MQRSQRNDHAKHHDGHLREAKVHLSSRNSESARRGHADPVAVARVASLVTSLEIQRVNPTPVPPSGDRDSSATLSVVESRFRGAIAASLDAFFLCESVRADSGEIVDFRILELNERAETLLARSRLDLIGRLVCDVVPSIRESGLLDRLTQVVETGESFEDELRFDDDDAGQTRWMRHQVVRVEDGLAITSRDITKRKHVEESLVQSEARFRHLVESASDGIYRIDTHGVFTYANPIASRLLGYSPDEGGIVGRIYLEFVRRDYHEQGIALYKRQVVERIPVTYWEFPAIAVDGRELWIGQNVHIEQRNGFVTSLFAVARDITERKTAELALRESEERYRFLTEQSTDMLSRQAADGRFLYVSPVSQKLLGYSAVELVGTSIFEYCHADDLEAMRAATARLVGHKGSETLTYRARRRDGHYVWIETTSQAVRDPSSGLVGEVLSVSRDITERRRLEEELRQAQKMDAVGQLAGGVAHDFNNLLTAIRGFTDLLARSLEPEDARRKDIAEILKATERAASLTRQLLAFSKRQVLRVEVLSVNGIVEDMSKIIRRLLGESIKVETQLEPRIWTIRADPGQLEQVLLNLALNARDAMSRGGRLIIATEQRQIEPAEIPSGFDAAPGAYVRLRVSDSGCGIPAENLPRIFEPFFTTKGVGRGTGLGLATVYGIVRQHHGWIEVTSTPGGGSSFDIHLPAAPAAEPPDEALPAALASAEGGRKVVLVLEDDPPLRSMICNVLAHLGYHTLEAETAAEASEIWKRDKIDLALIDVVLPGGVNGREFADQLRAERADFPVVFTNGYPADGSPRDIALPEGAAVLRKPFSPDELATALRTGFGGA